MNEKDNFEYSSDSENEKIKENTREKSEVKLPLDMKSFWKTIDEKFFTFKEFCSPYEFNYKINSLSKYGIYK